MIREIFFYITIIITIINTYYLYFFEGYLAGMPGNKFAIITFLILLLIVFFFTLNNLSIKRSIKKNSLRISFSLTIILFISSLFQRAIELQDTYFLWRWSQTILYLIIILLIISTSNKLYKLLEKLKNKNPNKQIIIKKEDFL